MIHELNEKNKDEDWVKEILKKNTIIPNYVKFDPKLDYQTNILNILEDILKTAECAPTLTAIKIKKNKSFFMALAKVSDMEKPSHILFERMMK